VGGPLVDERQTPTCPHAPVLGGQRGEQSPLLEVLISAPDHTWASIHICEQDVPAEVMAGLQRLARRAGVLRYEVTGVSHALLR
jgi:hypothetical protein